MPLDLFSEPSLRIHDLSLDMVTEHGLEKINFNPKEYMGDSDWQAAIGYFDFIMNHLPEDRLTDDLAHDARLAHHNTVQEWLDFMANLALIDRSRANSVFPDTIGRLAKTIIEGVINESSKGYVFWHIDLILKYLGGIAYYDDLYAIDPNLLGVVRGYLPAYIEDAGFRYQIEMEKLRAMGFRTMFPDHTGDIPVLSGVVARFTNREYHTNLFGWIQALAVYRILFPDRFSSSLMKDFDYDNWQERVKSPSIEHGGIDLRVRRLANLAVVTADELKFGQKGLELINRHFPNPDYPASPIPIQREF